MNVFLDTNILIDVIENREGTVFAKQLLQLGKDKYLCIFLEFCELPLMSSREFLLYYFSHQQ